MVHAKGGEISVIVSKPDRVVDGLLGRSKFIRGCTEECGYVGNLSRVAGKRGLLTLNELSPSMVDFWRRRARVLAVLMMVCGMLGLTLELDRYIGWGFEGQSGHASGCRARKRRTTNILIFRQESNASK